MDNEDAELRTLRVFLSYSHIDKELAGEIKEKLEEYGLESFWLMRTSNLALNGKKKLFIV